MCVETNYININTLVERFGLRNLYQVYSNELIRFVVDEFVISNNIQPIYNDYQSKKIIILILVAMNNTQLRYYSSGSYGILVKS